MVTRDEELKWAYLLDPCFELTNSAGKPLTDGYIEVYIAGTRDRYYCASDFSGTLHPLQIPLDSLGSNIVLANPDNAYDVYVYNRFGNLIMSRYNVTPADGGAVISNTERINELEELVVSAVTGLQGQIDDINEALDGKKDKQEEYSVTLTPTQTVSAIIQNENGEIEVIYQEIDLPDNVPNVNIVSPASTINITANIDEETNTKTFSIDLSDLGHLEYGQFTTTSDVTTTAYMVRNTGNLFVDNGKIKLHKSNSYHITLRGYYTPNSYINTAEALQYIEPINNDRMRVSVDNTDPDNQYFEISYDIFKLLEDTDYQVAFVEGSGTVHNLVMEVHSLSNVSVVDPDYVYHEGWGINIVSSVISVDPTILEDYALASSVPTIQLNGDEQVTAINNHEIAGINGQEYSAGEYISINEHVISVTGLQPEGDYLTQEDLEGYATETYVDNSVSGFTTHTEVYEATVTAVQTATGAIPESEEVQFEEINLADYALASSIPDVSNFTTNTEVYNATVTAIQVATGAIPDHLEAGQYVSIEDNVITVTGLQPEGDYATDAEVYNATVTAINTVTAIIPDAQVQSDWTEEDSNDPAYIKHKPVEKFLIAGDGITFTESATGLVISAAVTGIEGYVTETEFIEVVSAITGVGDYGQFFCVSGTNDCEMSKVLGTLDVNEEGEIELEAGKSYHVTVRGGYDNTVLDNSNSTIALVEYVTNRPIYINIDRTTSGIKYFEVSYDLYNLATDYDYVVAFSGVTNNGLIKDLTVQIHTIGSAGANGGGGTVAEYTPGYGINILNNVISFDTSVLPDLTGYATHTEVYNATVTAVDTVTGSFTAIEPGQYIAIQNDTISVTGLQPVGNYATQTQLDNYALASSVPTVQLNGDNQVTGIDGHAIAGSSFSQVQSNWNETNTSSPAYIQNKPDIPTIQLNSNDQVTAINNHEIAGTGGGGGGGTTYTAGQYISIDGNDVISVTGLAPVSSIPDVSDMATKTWVGNQGYLTSVPSNYVTDQELVEAVTAVTSIIPAAQVNSDWNANSGVAEILNKPEEIQLIAGDNVQIEVSGASAVISAQNSGTTYTAGQYVSIDDNDVISVTGLQVAGSYATTSDISDMATKTWVNNQGFLTSIPSTYATDTEVSEAIATATNDMATKTWVGNQGYLTAVPSTYATDAEVSQAIASATNDMATQTWVGNQGFLTSIPSTYATDTEVYEATVTAVQTATGLIPDTSDMATKTWVGNQGYLTEVPSTYATDTEVSEAIVTGVQVATGWVDSQGYLTEIPSTYATDTEVYNATVTAIQTATGTIPDVSDMATQTWVNSQGFLTSVPDTYATDSEVYNAIVTGVQTATALIPDTSDMATQTWVGNQGYLTSVPDTYATDVEVSQAIASSTADFVTESQVTALIPGTEDIQFKEIYLDQFAQASAIPTIELNSSDQVTGIDGYAIAGGSFTQVQSNWNEADNASPAYIQNKPDLTSFATVSAVSAIVDAEVSSIISVPPTSGLDTTKHYYLAWDNTNGVHWEVGDLGAIETALANL